MSATKTHLWLRAETKPGERRTILLPSHVKQLLATGKFEVTVEHFPTRCIPDSEYECIPGVKMAAYDSWMSAPKDAVIVGLKELPEADTPLVHKHIYFAHCYKNQSGWDKILNRFIAGNGTLYDLEFVRYADGRRVAAFGYSAGYVGMAVGLLAWCHQLQHPKETMPALDYHNDFKALSKYVKDKIEATKMKPKVLVVGALGRCGTGATDCAKSCGLADDQILKWDLAETKVGGPFKEMTQVDVLCNCIFLSATMKPKPFITPETLAEPGRRLRVVADVSCDPNNPNNPIMVPNYDSLTNLKRPTLRCIHNVGEEPPLDVVAIDHLPSLVPLESSTDYANQMVTHILNFPDHLVWNRTLEPFTEKTDLLKKH